MPNQHVKIVISVDTERFGDLTDDELQRVMTLASVAHDYCLVEAERRGLVSEHQGHPLIPYDLPEGMDWPETILTRDSETIPLN